MSANDSEHAEPKAQRPSPRRKPQGKQGKQASVRPLPATLGGRAHETSDVAGETSDERAVATPDDQREAVWTLHLRGVSQRQIARQLDLHRDTVGRLIRECYRDFGAERRARMKRGLEAAVARMRHVQEQAWVDHDADDERERAVLEAAVPGMRYTSQRASYLRLALDAEKEIARLEGLYAEDAPDLLGVLFQVIRVESGRRPERPERQERVVVEASDAQDD